ncbi:MAG: MFS transporter [Microcystaceae cyanobacterium]
MSVSNSPEKTQSINVLSDSETQSSQPNLPSNKGFSAIFNNPRFLTLWLGQIFSQLADKVYLVLMIALIAGYFQGEDQPISGWVSAIMIAFTIPAVLFGSLAGVFVDRWSKKGVLVISNFLRSVLVLIIPPLLWLSLGHSFELSLTALPLSLRQWDGQIHDSFSLPMGFVIILTLTFICSTITQFFAPAEQVTIPLVVKRHNLLPANSLFTTTMMAMTIIGFAIGDPLLEIAANFSEKIGFSWSLGKATVVGGAYLIAAAILTVLRTGEKKLPKDHEHPHVLEDLREGIKYLRENHKVRNALVQLVILFSIFAALSVLAVRLAETIPGLKAEQFGFLLAGCGVGMGIGAGIVGNWGQKFTHSQLSILGSLGMAISLVGLSFVTYSLWLVLLMIVSLGLFAAMVGVPMQTMIQAETPVEMRGKVFGLQNNAVNIALSVPLALAGIAETLVGLSPVLLTLAALSVLGSVLTRLID